MGTPPHYRNIQTPWWSPGPDTAKDDLRRVFATDLSVGGLYIERLRQPQAHAPTFLQLEIPLPGAPHAIWASAEIVFGRNDMLFQGSGARFTAMSPIHARWLREWLHENARTARFLEHPRRHAESAI
jgi:hypothetical protein